MSKSKYRKVHTDNGIVKYVIGKKFVKIRTDNGSEVIPKSEIGVETETDLFTVTPGMIKLYLNGEKPDPKDFLSHCECEDVEKTVGVNPFCDGFYDREYKVYWCENCFHEASVAV